MNKKPIIGITTGDPAGIGPEIVLKVLKYRELSEISRPVVIATKSLLERESAFELELIENERCRLIDIPLADACQIKHGEINSASGRASYDYILKAIELFQAGEIDALVTSPITKASLEMASIPFMDHTEILQAHFRGKAVTLLVNPFLRVAHVMRHLSLKETINKLTGEAILKTIVETHDALKSDLGIASPRLMVAGLNPHNGESGLMGHEEETVISPAVKEALKNGIPVSGPFAADSVFPRAMSGEADAVIAMYHDQGHIAIKASDWKRSHGITLGLEIPRTSVDHGSALDIAGKNKASEEGLFEAIRAAVNLAGKRRERTL